jgi:hypothetical protein
MSEASILRSETAALERALARLKAGSSTANSIETAVCGSSSAYRPEYREMAARDARRLRQATELVQSAVIILQGGDL